MCDEKGVSLRVINKVSLREAKEIGDVCTRAKIKPVIPTYEYLRFIDNGKHQ